MVDIVRSSRTVRFETAIGDREEVVPMFRAILEREDFGGATVLDVATGTGRLALLLAPRARKVIGVDIDNAAISAAREAALLRNLDQAEFIVANVESSPWSAWSHALYDFVTANLFMSESCVGLAGRHLRVGGRFLFCCHHTDHWKETRQGSRWAMDEDRMIAVLESSGFAIEFLGVDTTTEEFDWLSQVEEVLGPRRVRTWIDDGRWAALSASFAAGKKQLTRSYLIGRARKAPERAGSKRAFEAPPGLEWVVGGLRLRGKRFRGRACGIWAAGKAAATDLVLIPVLRSRDDAPHEEEHPHDWAPDFYDRSHDSTQVPGALRAFAKLSARAERFAGLARSFRLTPIEPAASNRSFPRIAAMLAHRWQGPLGEARPPHRTMAQPKGLVSATRTGAPARRSSIAF